MPPEMPPGRPSGLAQWPEVNLGANLKNLSAEYIAEGQGTVLRFGLRRNARVRASDAYCDGQFYPAMATDVAIRLVQECQAAYKKLKANGSLADALDS